MDISKDREELYDTLKRLLALSKIPNEMWSDKCDYMDVDGCKNLNPLNYNFTVMQLNVRGILSNQMELKKLLNDLRNRNTEVDVLLLSETFLSVNTIKLVNIKGYNIYSNHRKEHKGGGTAILIKQSIHHKRQKGLEIMQEKETESTYIEVMVKNGKWFLIGSLYRAPNMTAKPLISHIHGTVNKVKSEKGSKDIIMGMDHNLDLLKTNQHKDTRVFLYSMLDLGLIPTIMQPTRITHLSATLIDNVFMGGTLQRNFESCVIMSDLSDHLPSLALLKQTKVKDKKTRYMTSKKILKM